MNQSKNELKQSAEAKLERWQRMIAGDTKALVEIMVERNMATREDFPEFFVEESKQKGLPPAEKPENA